MELLYDPAISLLGIYPKELKTESQRDNIILMFIEALFKIVKMWKQPKCPQIYIHKQNLVYTCNGILLSLKEEGNSDTCYNVNEVFRTLY